MRCGHLARQEFESDFADLETEAQRGEETYTGQVGGFFFFFFLLLFGVHRKEASEARTPFPLDWKMLTTQTWPMPPLRHPDIILF